MFGLSSLLLAALIISTEVVELQTPSTDSIAQQEISIQEDKTSLSPEDVAETKTQPITVTNAIEPSMLKYKHWTGSYSPEIFIVTINDAHVASGETCTLETSETPLVVQFEYSFMNGVRKGSKKISYQMNKECTDAKITFSWLDTWQVIIDNATPLKAEVIS